MIGKLFKITVAAVIIGVLFGSSATLYNEGYYPGAVVLFVIALSLTIMALPFVAGIAKGATRGREKLVRTSPDEITKTPLYKQSILVYIWVKIFGKSSLFILPDESEIYFGKDYHNMFFVTHAAYKVKPEYELTDRYGNTVSYIVTIYDFSDAIKARLFGDPSVITDEEGIINVHGYIFGGRFYVKDVFG